MKKYDWKNEYNPIRRTAKRLLSGEALTDGRPLSDLIELDEHTRKCLAFEATLTDRQIDMLQELGYGNVQQGDDLVKGIQAWMLTPVFKIHDRAWGTVYKLCKIFLRPTFRLSLALDLPA